MWITVSQEILTETSVQGLLQRIADAALLLTGARLCLAGHGPEAERFQAGVVAQAPDSPARVAAEIFTPETGAGYLALVEHVTSLRLPDEELRRHAAWPSLPQGRRSLRGALAARLIGLDQQVSGLILVSDKADEGEFSAEDETLLVQLATLASLGLQHVQARQEAERRAGELAVERARLTAIIDNAPEGIIVTDAQARIVLANPAAERLYGRPLPYAQDYASHAGLLLTYPDGTPYEARDMPLTRAALDGEVQTDLEVGIRWPNGEMRSLLINASPMRDRRGRFTGAMAVFQDITQRKMMEESLRRRNRDLDLLNRISQALTAILDLTQLLEYLSEAMAEIVSAEGSSVWLWDRDSPGQLRCHALYVNGQSVPSAGLQLWRGQGLAGWVAQHGSSVMISDAALDGRYDPKHDSYAGLQTISLLAVPLRVRESVIGVLQAVNKRGGPFSQSDVSLAETLGGAAAIAIENARLVDKLRQRTAELHARNEELAAFAHTVAHDLKQPLAVMLGYADVLREEGLSLEPHDLHRHLGAVARIGYKMRNIIDSLLLLAEVREGEVEIKPVDMAPVVAEALQRLSVLIADKQAEIIVPDAAAWPAALGHAAWLEEVWVNYVSNALQYGGRPPRVELGGTARPDGTACFWVSDNGAGLTYDEQARLFAPFTRLDEGQATGHGLGLSIVRRIIDKLGGQVAVESEGVAGHGTTFSFMLPAAGAGEEPTP